VAYSLGVAIGLLSLFRRRWPLLVLYASAFVLQVFYLSDYPGIWPALPLSVALATAIATGHRGAALAVAVWYTATPVLWLTIAEGRPLARVLRDSLSDEALMLSVLLLGETIRTRRALDREHRALEAERERSEQLLLNILPASIAARLKQSRGPIADRYPDVSVLFADLVGFTRRSAALPAETIVASLNDLVSEFDELARERGLEKIKTIGDAYMVAGGLPDPRDDHLEAAADMALAMLVKVSERRARWWPARDPDRYRFRPGGCRRHRYGQVRVGHLGRHRQHGESNGVDRRSWTNPDDGGRLCTPSRPLPVRGTRPDPREGKGRTLYLSTSGQDRATFGRRHRG
jgi:class 3 adenylate cyclase